MPSDQWTWGDLATVVYLCPHDAPLRRVQAGCGHTLVEHLLMMADHCLAVRVWQSGSARRHDMPRLPECMIEPGLRQTRRYGSAAMTLEEAAEWLALPGRNAT